MLANEKHSPPRVPGKPISLTSTITITCRMKSLDLMCVEGVCVHGLVIRWAFVCAERTCMWKPENNVLLPSSLVLDFTLRFVFWDKLSHRTCSFSIQLHGLWGPVQYGGYVQRSLLHLAFTWWSGWEPRSSSLYYRRFTNWAISLDIV